MKYYREVQALKSSRPGTKQIGATSVVQELLTWGTFERDNFWSSYSTVKSSIVRTLEIFEWEIEQSFNWKVNFHQYSTWKRKFRVLYKLAFTFLKRVLALKLRLSLQSESIKILITGILGIQFKNCEEKTWATKFLLPVFYNGRYFCFVIRDIPDVPHEQYPLSEIYSFGGGGGGWLCRSYSSFNSRRESSSIDFLYNR